MDKMNEVDRLRLHNAMLQSQLAQVHADRAKERYQAVLHEMTQGYGLDPDKDGVDFSTGVITRG